MDIAERENLALSEAENLARERAEKLARSKAEWLRKCAALAAKETTATSSEEVGDPRPQESAQKSNLHAADDPHERLRRIKLEWLRKQKLANAGSITVPKATGVLSEPKAEVLSAVATDDTPSPEKGLSSFSADSPCQPGKRKSGKERWSPEKKLEAAEKRASEAAAQAGLGSPVADANAKKLEEAAKTKARKLEKPRQKGAVKAGESGTVSSAERNTWKLERERESRPSGDTLPRERRNASSVRGRSDRQRQTKQIANLPEWRAKAAKNLAARETGGMNCGNEVDLDGDSLVLNKLHRDLTQTLARFEGASSSCGGGGLRRLHGGEEDKWAFVDEGNIDDFHDRVPDMALRFPFDLDIFQKRAILHVEQRNNVFVAAHTSAGKTVVAEYAIALAAELGAKVFYTSPIKTLSNQKLRDFRGKFEDVGLVTGDVSINEDAQCVIMTTEILRSMLYRGADVIRDLMFVIFDEVQFLNDEERGVVWEESIIMLPPHVGIIMLSATVPNAVEFASWVGKTKGRKVAVVSTTKRPVPLLHSWLHRKIGAPDDLTETVLLKQGGSFLHESYRAALKANRRKESGSLTKRGGGEKKSRRKRKGDRRNTEHVVGTVEEPERSRGPSVGEVGSEWHVSSQEASSAAKASSAVQDGVGNNSDNLDVEDEEMEPEIQEISEQKEKKAKPIPKGFNKNKGQAAKGGVASLDGSGDGPNKKDSPWSPLVRFLHEGNRTPSVVFCFSKKKCEKAVESLENSDLLPDATDKAVVHRFFEDSIVKLREEDRALPQVLRVRANLKRGISAHHAGLLPLIKEITEILFSKGLVKVLFATETFALGVNMPARTVVFSGVRKHDGRNFRFLEAGEYTQMSGRAGRRGLDNVGHVYLFFPPDERCPNERQLCNVMTGKPISLTSAFRLTYNMILNVLRVDEMRVEEMMKQSFSEAGEDAKVENISSVLEKAGDTLSRLNISDASGKSMLQGVSQESSEEMMLSIYAQKFCQLSEASAKLTFRELDPVFERGIVPGRLIVAEVQPGLLSLAVVYSIVRRDGRIPKVRQDTQIWVVALTGVVPSHLEKHRLSVLLFPEPRRNRTTPHLQAGHPRVCTNDGLVVTLREIHASKIVYICGECDILSASREADQERAAKRWFFARKRLQEEGRGQVAGSWCIDKKTLHANAEYLQQVLSKWEYNGRKKDGSPIESFPAEHSVSNNDRTVKKSRRQNRVHEMHPLYDARRKLCLELITDVELGKGVATKAGNDFVSTVERRILEESVRNKMAALKTVSDTGSQPSLLPEYLKRVQVLQKLDYVDADGLGVKMKGRCGCAVSTADSVVLTEIILENVLDRLEASEICSLLSSLVCRKKNASGVHDSDTKTYSEMYCVAKAKMREVVERVGKVQEECGVELDFDIADGGDDYESSICRWDLAHAVYAWAKGEPFFSITDLTEQQEGDIVVCVKRLSELLKDAHDVAKGIGNDDLQALLEEAGACIRRDVIFNGSLYYDDAAKITEEILEE